MATRSYLIAAEPGPQTRLIYCHLGSRTYQLGLTLSRHYADPGRVKQLLDQGDATSIEPAIGDSIFRHRPDRAAHSYPSTAHALRAIQYGLYPHIEYVYIYNRKSRQWSVIFPERDTMTEPTPVGPEIMAADLMQRIKPECWGAELELLAQRDPDTADRVERSIARRLKELP